MRTRRMVGAFMSFSSFMSKASSFSFVQLSSLRASFRSTRGQARARSTLAKSLPRERGGEDGIAARPTGAALLSSCYAWHGSSSKYSSSTRRVNPAAVLTVTLLSSPLGAQGTAVGGGMACFLGSKKRLRSRSYRTSAMAASVSSTATTAALKENASAVKAVGGSGKLPVIFVLGGPGSGKGTQCERLAKEYGYVHLSAGELLRQERESGSSDGQLIDEYIREGRIVPVAVSLGLLQKAMEASPPFSRFLIDGFPRNSDNVQGWNTIMKDVADVRCVLFLHCPEDVLEKRLLVRGKSSGRTDDNAETAKRRFQTYVETTLPVVERFEQQGLVARVNGNQGIEDVFRDVLSGLKPVQEREVLDSNKLAVDALVAGDLSTYRELCMSDMTELLGEGLTHLASAPENSSHSDSISGVCDQATTATKSEASSSILNSSVRMLNGGAAVATCERPQGRGLAEGNTGSEDGMVQETRVWEMRDGRWRCVHCHTSTCGAGETASSLSR